jgi:DNA-binding beta-propeller fold protein YncE
VLAYDPDDGFIYAMVNGGFQRHTTAGALDPTTLAQPRAPKPQGLVYIGGDQFVALADDQLYQYDAVVDVWTDLATLSQSFPDAHLAFDFGVLYAITSSSDRMFKIDLATFAVTDLFSRGTSNRGGLSTTCMPQKIVAAVISFGRCAV